MQHYIIAVQFDHHYAGLISCGIVYETFLLARMQIVSLTVLFPKFLTRQLRYVVFPSKAVTFFEADLSKYGPDRAGSSREFWMNVSLLLPLPPCGILWQCTSETRSKRCVNAAISTLSAREDIEPLHLRVFWRVENIEKQDANNWYPSVLFLQHQRRHPVIGLKKKWNSDCFVTEKVTKVTFQALK